MNRKSLRILTKLYGEPWLIKPETHKVLCGAFGQADGYDDALAQMGDILKAPEKRAFEVVGNTAVIPLEGVILRKFSTNLYEWGITSVDVFTRLVNLAASDEEVHSIFLNVDSPGGVVDGVPEAARAVAAANAVKPVLAYADGQMASAAYWIASQAEAIYATESADIGSIGVYAAFLDQTRAAEIAGLKVEVFKSGKYKGQGIPGTPLSDEMRGMIQERVDATAQQFKQSVTSARKVPDGAMEGQSFSARDAKAFGLIDDVSDADEALFAASQLATMRTKKG